MRAARIEPVERKSHKYPMCTLRITKSPQLRDAQHRTNSDCYVLIKNTEHREYSPGQNTCLTLCAGSVVAPFICKCSALHYSVQSCDARIFACAWGFGGVVWGIPRNWSHRGSQSMCVCVVWFWFREPPNRRIQPAVEINAIFIFSMNIQWNGGRNGIGFRII